MINFYKILSIFIWLNFSFATIADVGNPLEQFDTFHNGSPDANLTIFTLDGSNSDGAITYEWVQISSGPYIEEFIDCNSSGSICQGDSEWDPSLGNGVWDDAEEFIDSDGNGQYDVGEVYIDSDNSGFWTDAEDFTDSNGNNIFDFEPVFEDPNSNPWSGLFVGEEFIDANGNGSYDIGEDYDDNNNNGQRDEGYEAIVSFKSAVYYATDSKRYKFKLTITNSNNQSVSDTKIVIINPEPNNPPTITFQNLDSYIEDFTDTNGNDQWDEGESFIDLNDNGIWDNQYSIQCGGSTDGGEDGFECVLLFLDENYIDSVIDPDGDVLEYEWENSEGQDISTELYSFEFESPSDSHDLRVVARDSYQDISEVVVKINSSISNTFPEITMQQLYLEDENSLIVIEAQVVDSEHLLNEIDFVWEWSCSGCDENLNYISNPRFDQVAGTAAIDFNAPNVSCNEDQSNSNPQFTITLIARDPFQQSDSDLAPSQASSTIIINNINEDPQVLSLLNSFENIQEDTPFPILIDDFEILDLDECSNNWSLSVVPGGLDYDVTQISGTNYISIFNQEETLLPFTEEIIVRITDSQLADVTHTFSVSVAPVNDRPEIGVVSAFLATEDVPYTLNIDDLDPQDPDSDSFTIIYPSELPEGIASINNDVITFEEHFFGSISFPVSISDGDLTSSEEQITIIVAPINDGPVYVGSLDRFFLNEDFGEIVLFDFNDEFNDVDLILDESETITFTLEYGSGTDLNEVDLDYAYLDIEELGGSSQNLNISSNLNSYSDMDDLGNFQSSQIIAVATDASLMYAQNTFEVTVLPQNDNPIAFYGIDSLGMNIDADNPTSILIDLTRNTSDNIDENNNSLYQTPYVEDVDGDDWSLQILNGPSNGEITNITDTSFIYWPNLNFRCIDQIEYLVVDNGTDFSFNESTGLVEETLSSLSSEPAIIEIIVDFCNSPPSIVGSDIDGLNELEFLEDIIIDVDADIDLSLFNFEDSNIAEEYIDANSSGEWDEGEEFIDLNANDSWDDGDEIVSIHAVNWTDVNENGEWDEGEDFYDCGEDEICFNDDGYTGPDIGESNSKYLVEAQCSYGDYIDQGQCEYNGGEWNTSIVVLPNYNGYVSVLLQANDGKDSYNLSEPYIIEIFVDAVNDAPIITDAYFIDEESNELIDEGGNRIDYIFEDDLNRSFKVIFEDIDSNLELNFNPFNEDDLYWNFSNYLGSPLDQKLFASFDDINKTFTIDSLKRDWNGSDFVEINVRDLNNATNSFIFEVNVKPQNDLPYNFSVNLYEDLSEQAEYPSFIYEDLAEVEDYEQNNYKAIKYSVYYDDIDSDYGLNQYENYEFIPDDIFFDDIYQGSNLLSFNINNDVDSSLENGLIYSTDIQYDELKSNWNGFDSIPVVIFTLDVADNLDTLLFPVEVLPINDSPDNFSISAELWDSPLDVDAFYLPCDGQPDDCSEIIHGAEFSRGDNFFTLHNDDSSVEASIEADSRFDSGKLLFKWDRSYDPDSDSLISEYFTSDLYYRIEVFESGQSDYYYVLDEIEDSIFDNNACDIYVSQNSDASGICQGFMNDSDFGWGIVDMQDLFFRYENGFYTYSDSIPNAQGFLTSIDSTKNEFSYGYLDKSGNTEYNWRVVAYNRWWDSRSVYNEYVQNEQKVSSTDTENMRFFIDLERPSADFSIIQNPLFNDLYELYITTDEDIKGEAQFGISNNQGDMIFGYIPEQILPCTDVNNDELCDDFDYYNAFTYAGEFDSERVFNYQLNAFDILGNAGISSFSLAYSYLLAGNFRLIESPMKSAEIVVFDYSLSMPASLIITESLIEYDNIGMTPVSNEINIFGQDLDFESPAHIRFSNNDFNEFDIGKLRICKKNQYDNWIVLESINWGEFIQADVDSPGAFALFLIDDNDIFVPEEFDLIGCYPNPFNPNINIQFSVPEIANVKVDIYDIAGRIVKSLANESMDPGIVDISWNGISDEGTLLSSGIYFIVLDMNNSTFIEKVTLLK
tara:strand:- start:7107 stop:13079 length:5973 start_codon:yes stop_codon:yes gene_type:complete